MFMWTAKDFHLAVWRSSHAKRPVVSKHPERLQFPTTQTGAGIKESGDKMYYQ